MRSTIEVFQDLTLQGPASRLHELKLALINHAIGDWDVDLRRSEQIMRSTGTDQDVLLFVCKQTKNHPEASLTLWGTFDGYYVPNIVPIQVGELTYREYNSVLKSFVEEIAAPVSDLFGFKIILTEPMQALSNWLSEDAEIKLKRFSNNANKSTGASHPMDESRWYDFIVAAHRDNADFNAEILSRWLHEVEKWDEDSAYKLSAEYENARSLLNHYDKK